jgi:hypothetical protein
MACEPCVWRQFLVYISLIKYVKRLVLLAESLSSSSCCPAA